jgi:L-iditol 2-dehydrogenase
MRALRKLRPDAIELSVTEVETPEPGPGEARLTVIGAGLCATDLHILHGSYSSRPPVTLGHEIAGIVDAVGEGVGHEWIGSRVAPETAVSCGTCEWCRTGKPMLCADRLSLGSGVDGGFATHVVVPARNLHRLPDSVSERAAAVAEPLACVCNALTNSSVVTPGDRVIVIGPGTVGILAAQVATAAGGQVTLVGTNVDAPRLEVAAGLGIDARSLDDPASRHSLEAEASARQIHVVVECAGVETAVAWGLTLVRPRGRYVQLGLLTGNISVPFGEIVLREIAVTSGFGSSPASWHRAMALLAAALVSTDPLVTRVLPLGAWREAVQHLQNHEGIKTIFDPRLA